MSSSHVNVIGAGGHAKVVVRALLDQGYTVDVIYDDDSRRWGTVLLGCPVWGPVQRIEDHRGNRAVIALGDNRTRRRLAEKYALPWLTVVHPSALIDASVRLGPGTVVLQRAVIQPDACVGEHAIINTAATVDHDCLLGHYTHLAPGVHLAGGVTLEAGVFLGIGSVVMPGKTIGRWTTVGAGGVVSTNLPGNLVAVGLPARPIRHVDPPDSLEPVASPSNKTDRHAA